MTDLISRGTLPGYLLVTAGVLIASSAAFPRPADPGDPARFLRLLGDNAAPTKAILLAVPAGIWLLTIGIGGLVSSVGTTTEGGVVARMGVRGLVAGAAIVSVQFALGSGALLEGADTDRGVALWAASTHVRSFSMLVVWLSLAMVGSGLTMTRAPRWIGSPLVLLGLGVGVVSIASILVGLTPFTAASSGVLAAATAIWAILAGAWLAHRSAEVAAVPTAQAGGKPT